MKTYYVYFISWSFVGLTSQARNFTVIFQMSQFAAGPVSL